jgi:hypothetical protein
MLKINYLKGIDYLKAVDLLIEEMWNEKNKN